MMMKSYIMHWETRQVSHSIRSQNMINIYAKPVLDLHSFSSTNVPCPHFPLLPRPPLDGWMNVWDRIFTKMVLSPRTLLDLSPTQHGESLPYWKEVGLGKTHHTLPSWPEHIELFIDLVSIPSSATVSFKRSKILDLSKHNVLQDLYKQNHSEIQGKLHNQEQPTTKIESHS